MWEATVESRAGALPAAARRRHRHTAVMRGGCIPTIGWCITVQCRRGVERLHRQLAAGDRTHQRQLGVDLVPLALDLQGQRLRLALDFLD